MRRVPRHINRRVGQVIPIGRAGRIRWQNTAVIRHPPRKSIVGGHTVTRVAKPRLVMRIKPRVKRDILTGRVARTKSPRILDIPRRRVFGVGGSGVIKANMPQVGRPINRRVGGVIPTRRVARTKLCNTKTTNAANPMTDFDLISCVLAGETEAFSPLVRRYQDRLIKPITRRVSDPEVAKDLTQVVWFRAYRGIRGFRGDSAFYSWLYRIAENVIVDHFRKLKTAAESLEPLHAISEHRLIDTAPCPSVSVLRGELIKQLRAAICELPPMRRRVSALLPP